MLPECLQLLPLYALGLQKSLAYRGGDAIRSDERASLVYRILTMPVCASKPFIHPRLYSLHDMGKEAGQPDASLPPVAHPHPHAGQRVAMPSPSLPLSAASLNPGGAYLLDAGMELFLWLGRSVPEGLLRALFGPAGPPAPADAAGCGALPAVEGSAYSARVCALLRTLRSEAPATHRLRIVRDGAGDAAEARFLWHMVEDKQNFSGGTASYVDYVTQAHNDSLMPAMTAQMGGGGPN